MFQQVSIKHFRLFGDLEIDRLSRINLLGGRNNSGKTTALEALFLLSGGGNPELALRISFFRGIKDATASEVVVPATYWKPLFSEFDMHSPIEINGEHSHIGTLALTISLERQNIIELIKPNAEEDLSDPWVLKTSCTRTAKARARPGKIRQRSLKVQARGAIRVTGQGLEIEAPKSIVPFRAVFVSSRSGSLQEDAARLGRLRTQKQGDLLTKALRIVEPRLQGVEDNSASGTPMIWGDIGLRELVPLSAMGEGMTRVSRLVLAISSARGGVVLMDEIENGIHHSIMGKVWEVVAEAAQLFDTQVFATTHSFECFQAAHESLSSDEWRYYRLDRNNDGASHCITFDPEDVETAVRHGMEVR